MAAEDWGQMLEDEEKRQQEQQLISKVFKIGVCLLFAGLTTHLLMPSFVNNALLEIMSVSA